MPTRVLHLSDLHFGRGDSPESIEALARLVAETQPELVIASGDLTHRGRRDQHEQASAFLRSLELPLLVIPGNHDIPYTFPKRFTSPWQEFERLWQTTEPVHRSDGLVVVGLNSVRPWRHQSGRLRDEQVQRAARAPRRGRRRDVSHRRAPPSPPRRSVAVAEEARRAAEPRARGARRRGRRPRPRRPHPPEHGRRAARVRALVPGRRACRRRLDRAGLRPAAPAPARRGARPARLRDRARRAAHPHLHLARGRLGAHGRADVPARPWNPRLRIGAPGARPCARG